MVTDESRKQYQDFIDSLNRSTDHEIDEAMVEILRKQREVRVLRPATRKLRPAKGAGGDL